VISIKTVQDSLVLELWNCCLADRKASHSLMVTYDRM